MRARLRLIEETWRKVQHRYTAYGLVMPGEPSFICQAEKCEAHCCLVFSVSLGEREAERMQRFSGLELVDLVECEDGRPIHLPMAQPYLLKRDENRCAFLAPDLRCGQYEGRPDACRLYPHQMIFVDTATHRPVHGDVPRMRRAMEWALTGASSPDAGCVPLFLRHLECPGFTGPPTTNEEWAALLARTYELQFQDGLRPAATA
jgi:Fe-S-cluster containining protein